MSMKQIWTLPRITSAFRLPSCSILCSIILFSLVFLIPIAHSRTNRNIDHNIRRMEIVDQFKAKILQHMGLSAPPKGYNASRDSLRGKLLKELLRKTLETSDGGESGHLIDGQDTLQTVVFTSTEPELLVPLQSATTPSPKSSDINVVKFRTNFQQPEVQYHYLVLRSAILRMSISYQKRKLLTKQHKNTLRVNVYMFGQPDGTTGSSPTASLIYSSIVNPSNMSTIEVNIQTQLLSHVLESEDQIVVIGITIEENHKNSLGNHSKQITKSSSNQIRVSQMKLEISTSVKDLRKIRSKRHVHETCNDNLCCRHSVYVDFEEIGWNNWLLNPSGYTAYYCNGGCPRRHKMASSFTGIKSILHEKMPDIIPGPVCAPTGYQPLDALIFDGEHVKDVSLPGMVVAGCRCY